MTTVTTEKKSYDPKCYELAVHFLIDEPSLATEENRELLASSIQTAVEDWFQYMKAEESK